MNRLFQAAFYSFLLTLFGASAYYLLGLLITVSQGGDVNAFLWNTFVGSFICFGFLTFLLYDLMGTFERLNKRGREDKDKDDKDDKSNPPRS